MYKSNVVKWDLQYEAPPIVPDQIVSADTEVYTDAAEIDAVIDMAPGLIENRMAEAAEKARTIIEDTLKEAEAIRLKALGEAADIMSEAELHAQYVVKKAEDEGYANGFIQGEINGHKKSIDNAAVMISEINSIAEEMKRLKLDAARDMERELICIALEAAGKVMRQQCRVDTGAVSKMLEEVIAETEGVIKIYLSELQNTLEMHLDKSIVKKIRSFAKDLKTVIVSEPDSILLETETGIVDLSIQVQRDAIKNNLMADFEAQGLH